MNGICTRRGREGALHVIACRVDVRITTERNLGSPTSGRSCGAALGRKQSFANRPRIVAMRACGIAGRSGHADRGARERAAGGARPTGDRGDELRPYVPESRGQPDRNARERSR